jgi:acid phosphatase family membrane protein YuiD
MINFPLEAALYAMVLAQLIKLPIQFIIDKKWTPSIIFSTGGMPSSHSAFVTALTIGLAIQEGIKSPLFAISLVLALVVIHDSIGIRREAGKHASVLNRMQDDLEDLIGELKKGQEKDKIRVEKKLKELLGHEPFEALSGTLFGVIIVAITYGVYFL